MMLRRSVFRHLRRSKAQRCLALKSFTSSADDPLRHPVSSTGPKGQTLPARVLSYERVCGDSPQWKTPVVMMHGMFGSKRDLEGVASRLGCDCVLLDLRNHGDSFHDDGMHLQDLADDLWATLEHLQIDRCHLMAHSFGGRVAMNFLLNAKQSPRVDCAFILDVAPVNYAGAAMAAMNHMIHTLRSVSLNHQNLVHALVEKGLAADSRALHSENAIRHEVVRRLLKPHLGDLPDFLMGYLLSNLVRMRNSDGTLAEEWRWKCNLPSIQANMEQSEEFEYALEDGAVCDSDKVLFIGGTESRYLRPKDPRHSSKLNEYFPNHKLTMIEGAQHFLHLDAPAKVVDLARDVILESK